MNSTSLKINSLSYRKDFFIRIENISKHVTANNDFHIIEISVVSLRIYIDRNRREDYSNLLCSVRFCLLHEFPQMG